MTVFNVEREEHASRIDRKEIGQQLENIPLEVLSVEIIEEDDDEEFESTDDTEESESTDDTEESAAASDDTEEDDEVLPEFEDLIE